MKSQSHSCTDLDVPDMKKKLLQNKGKFKREFDSKNRDLKTVLNVSWNKEKMSFNCSIAHLEKQKDGSWKCVMRFDDAHECRHADVDLPAGRTKMISGRFAKIKVECPILIEIINSLPKDKADEWKTKLFDEIVIGNQKWKEYLNNPERIHFY
jgi:hypothetical protein